MTGTAIELWRGPVELHTLRYVAIDCFGTGRGHNGHPSARKREARARRVWKQQVRRAGGRLRRDWRYRCCAACGSQRQLTVDHVIPKSRGGCNHIHNLQLLCFDCNQAKGDALPWELLTSLPQAAALTAGSEDRS
jgi:5-methylcytosine-specific restriction endonuclease McrA